MESREILKRPVITERSSEQMESLNKYTFEVDTRANKSQIKNAVEEIFGVEVAKVNVMNYKGKFKRMGRHAGYTNKRRKAVVTLTEGSKDIELFEI